MEKNTQSKKRATVWKARQEKGFPKAEKVKLS